MVGQKNLLNKLNSYTIDTFPRSIILIGEEGCGKHLITEYIKTNILKLPLLDITTNISNEFIDEIYRNPNPSIYLMNLNDIVEKEQNVLLKFIEEPLANSFIILLVNDKSQLLNTIYNRCVSFEFDAYTKDELSGFISAKDLENKDLILNVVRTPGRLKTINLSNIKDLYELCNKMVDKLSVARFDNTLSIANRINYKDEYNKYDINLFFDTLVYTLYNKYKVENNIKLLDMYKIVVNARKTLIDKRLVNQYVIENMLTKLWEVFR